MKGSTMIDRKSISRRRAISIIAGGLGALYARDSQSSNLHEWQGIALGANTRIILAHADRSFVDETIIIVRKEIERLEDIFSLYRPHSAVSRLNRNGVLRPAPLELIQLTQHALWFSSISKGAFDITVQPLWELYAQHFLSHPNDTIGPPIDAVRAARRGIGATFVQVDAAGIRLSSETRVTFNGIAQGYITDRVSTLLRARGWDNVLIDIGETRALGAHPDGRPWYIGLPNGHNTQIADVAIATSDSAGTRFTRTAPQHHLFDPRRGICAPTSPPVSVIAQLAVDADALSTALAVTPSYKHQKILDHVPDSRLVMA